MNKQSLQEQISKHSQQQDDLERLARLTKGHVTFLKSLQPNCANCEFEGRNPGDCKRWPGHVVPQHIREAGCDDWVYFDIPF